MTREPRNRIQRDDVLTWLGYALPVLGGLLGVVYVNVNHMEFINPVWAVGGGAILGWIAVRLIRKVLG
ncbi:hypothetical protein HW561_05715 [Rhodobacteraceae bacterium B1Z28]|uniref:Uncharacterized protein n=1 Tax=Ruegeria haliotis TaxID=2747601 RepID=A0ABX2PME6_9RHOB|nr:hypothetical protein [Ruegeria haliotis]NVO55284.1 hypothetical protein [Ruegeria haliotis]